jgi:hypothetical protein
MQLFQYLFDLLNRMSDKASVKRRRTGAAILRIVFGSVTAVLYTLHFQEREFLWGVNGMLTPADNAPVLVHGHAWSLYSLSASPLWPECLYWLGLLVSIAFAVGLFTRITSTLFFVVIWSLYQRNTYALDGGENLLVILAIYLIFADLSALSLDRRLFKDKGPGRFEWLSGMLHNFAVTACLVQLAIVYFEAGFYKIQGHVWSSGTAIYYILRSNGYTLPGWSDVLWRSAALVTIGTYGSMLFEIMHPFLMWNRRLKYLVVAGAVVLHGSIGLLMGLVWFSFTMIGVHAILFTDDEFRALRDFFLDSERLVAASLARAAARFRPAQPALLPDLRVE